MIKIGTAADFIFIIGLEENQENLSVDRIKDDFGAKFYTIGNNPLKYGNYYIIEEFNHSLKKYKKFSCRIFRGCTKSIECYTFRINIRCCIGHQHSVESILN